MSYTALYRKFRPKTFDEVKGQDPIVTTLKNQLISGRIGHAYLFCGTRGTGKTSVAKILARAVNCENPTENGPCNVCPACQAILSGRSTDVIEIDAASNNGVDNIREIREEVSYRPTSGRYRVYIIDEVHMLSAGAFNALLKTLEEPPEYVIFILATTEVSKIPVTILSRCQRYNFRRIQASTIADRLHELLREEGVEAEERAVSYIARAADGAMRDALSLLDECIAFYLGETLTYERVLKVLGTVDTDQFSRLLRAVAAGDAASAMRMLDGMIREGKDAAQLVTDLIWYLRNLMLVQSAENASELIDVSAENLQQLKEESRIVPRDTVMRYIRILSDLSGELRQTTQKRIRVEMTLIRLCRPQTDTDLDGVLDRIRVLEQRLESGDFVPRGTVSSAGGAQGTSGAQPGGSQQQNTAPVPKAAPEDLRRIASQWGRIVGMASGGFQSFLKSAVPKYSVQGDDSRLFLEVTSQNVHDILASENIHEELKELIVKAAGCTAEVAIVLRDGTGSNSGRLQEIPIEEALSELGLPVETVEDESDL